MPDSILDLDAFNAGFSQAAQVAQQRHDATGTGARMGANLKEGLWNLQAAGAGLVGADEARQEALASQRLSQDLRGAAADTAGEQAIGAAIESSPMTLASFLPGAVLRIPAARLAAGRTLQAATARGLGSAEAQMLARMAGEKAANVAARAGMAGGMGALSAPDAYDQAKTAGASDGTALANAIGSAFTEGAFTFMSPGGVESAMLTRPALTGGLRRVLAQGGRRLAGGVVGEAGEEVATEGAHILREQGLGINPGTLFDPANLERLGLSAAAGGLMGGGFTAPGVAVDAARQVPGAVAPAVLAARLRLAQPELAPQAQPEAPPAEMAPAGPSYADLTEQALASEAVRRGLPPDFTPLAPVPQGPAGQGFAGYAEPQQDPVAALAALFQAAQAAEPPVSGMIAPEVPNAPPAAPPAALVAPGPVPGGAPARAPASAAAPPPAPVAPQPAAPPAKAVGRAKIPKPAAAPAPTGQPAAAPSMPTPVPPPAAAVPAVAPAGDQPGTGFRVGQRVRWTKGKKQGVEATVTALTNGRPVLRTDDGKTIGAAGGITPDNLEAIADAPAAPPAGAAPVAPPRPGPAAASPAAAQPAPAPAPQPVIPAPENFKSTSPDVKFPGQEIAAPTVPDSPVNTGENAPTTGEKAPAAKRPTRSATLRESAARVRQKAQDEQNRERQSNTPKRAREAASAIGEAMQQESHARIADRIADAVDSGEAPALENVGSIQDVDTIMQALRLGRVARMSYAEEQQKKGQPFTEEDVKASRFRGGFVHETHVKDALKKIEGTKGAPALRKAIGMPNDANGYRITSDEDAKAFSELAKRIEHTDRYAAKSIREGVGVARRWFRLGVTDAESYQNLLRAALPFQQDAVDPAAKRRAELKAKEDAIRFTKIPGFFPTPDALADEAVRKADIQPGMRVLEPEGGKGDLAQRAEAAGGKVDVAETQQTLREILEAKGFKLVGRDMLEMQPPADGPVYDRIVMNPPFENGQDREHVRHAFDLLKPGGRLVAIMSPGPFQRSFKADQEFKAWAESVGAVVEDNEAGSFAGKDAFRQTGVHTVTVTIDKAAEAPAESPAAPAEAQAATAEEAPTADADRYADLLADPLAADIPLEAAMRGHSGTSMVPEQRARGEVADYVQHLRAVRERLNGIAKTPEQQAVADAEFARYRAGYRQRRMGALARRGRVMSAMVAGPSKFPVASNRKRSDAYEKSISEAVDWSERAQKSAIKAVRAAAPGGDPTAPVSSDDADAVEKLKGKIAQAERLQAAMVAGNKVVRDTKLSDDQKVARLVELGLSESNAREALKPDFAGRIGFPSYALTNNNANIRRMQERVAELERKRGQATRSVTVGEITVTDDVDGNRLRLSFPGKPSAELREKLKGAGFKWSPTEGVWQRMRGDGAVFAAERALGIDLTGLREQQAAPATPAPETGGDTAPSAPEQPAPEAAAPNPAPVDGQLEGDAPEKLKKLDDPRRVRDITNGLYRLVNAVGDHGVVTIKPHYGEENEPVFRLDVSGQHGDGTTGETTDLHTLRQAGIVLGANGRFDFDALTAHLQQINDAITGRKIKNDTLGRVKRNVEPRLPGPNDKTQAIVPDTGEQVAYSQREEDARPVIIDLEAINKDMQVGRVVAVPGGWRFVAPGGRGIGIRSATAEEARANEGRAEGYFTGVDPLTGEPQIVLIPGRTGAFTVNHELVHHARRLGVLTDAHLDALARIGAKHGIAAKWGKAYREAKPDITATELREEIAAKTVEAIKAGEIPLKPGFVQRFLDWVADLARAAAGLPASDRRLARDVVEGRVFEGGQEPAAATPAAGDQVFSLADDGEPEKRTPEERLAEARQGVKPGDKPNTDPTMLEEFRRHFRHLDPAKHAEAIAIIRELEARLDAAGGQAERIILGHVEGLNREQAEAFNDRLVLEDILRQIEGGEFDGGPTEDGRTAAQIGEQIRADITKAIERGGEPAAKAYERRRTFQERHTRALVDADLLPAEALDDPRYYHRQVLAHLGEKQSMGLGGSEVRNRTRGFQRGRSGGTAADIPFYGDEEARRDFNANYAQAEFEYLAQSVQELARADALERLEARYNQMRAAKAEAKARNRAAMDERWAKENTVAETGERDEEAIAEGWDKHWRGLIAMNQSSLADLAMVDSFGGPYDDVWQALGEARAKWHGENDDLEPRDRMPFVFDHPAWWKALAWLAAHPDVKVWREDSRGRGSESTPAIHALAIFKAVAGREEHVRETLGNEYQTWQDVAKDMNGMVRWQPEEGLQLVPGWAATDQAITNALRKAGVDDATVAEALPPAAPVGQALKRGLIVMGKKPEWLIPEALAKQLNDMRRVPDLNALGRIAETWSRRWKLWMLHQPMRVLKYQLNNLVGDLDVALTQPAIIKEVARERMQVARDLWAYTHGQALDPKTEAQMRRAQQMGLFDSGVSAAELPDVDKLPALKALFGQGWDKSWAGIPEVARRYFDSAQRFGRWREAIMRVSAARHFYREVSPQRRRYVASRKDELDQLYDRWSGLQDGIGAIYKRSNPTDADLARAEEMKREEADIHATIAAKLARELLGDYGNLSHAGQKLRRFLIPFWSWAEINAPRYVRLIKNARYEGGGGSGQALGASAAMAGGVAVRAAALTGMVFAWNAMMKAALGIGDDDDPNKEADMSKLMIILGKDGDGKVYGVRVAGALSDALGWLDMDNAWKHAKDLATGYREGKLAEAGMDVAGDMVSAPANRIAQGISPIVKVPIEQATRRQLFPNAFKPRPLSDRWGHLADAMGVGPAYRAATDRASVGNAAGGALLVTHDPAGAAAGRVRQDAEAWAQRNGKTIKAGGGVPTDQREALAQAKSAHARGEEARASRWLRRYFELGGKPGYLGSSRASMHPLSVILKEDRAAYLKSLDPGRRADYDKAVRRWHDLWENDGGMTALAGRVWREQRRAAAAGN